MSAMFNEGPRKVLGFFSFHFDLILSCFLMLECRIICICVGVLVVIY
jgi:hypothetical protein